MENEFAQTIINFILEQGIWCALFIWMFITSRKETQNRENRLNDIIDKEHSMIEAQGEKLEKISDTLDKMNIRIENIERQKD